MQTDSEQNVLVLPHQNPANSTTFALGHPGPSFANFQPTSECQGHIDDLREDQEQILEQDPESAQDKAARIMAESKLISTVRRRGRPRKNPSPVLGQPFAPNAQYRDPFDQEQMGESLDVQPPNIQVVRDELGRLRSLVNGRMIDAPAGNVIMLSNSRNPEKPAVVEYPRSSESRSSFVSSSSSSQVNAVRDSEHLQTKPSTEASGTEDDLEAREREIAEKEAKLIDYEKLVMQSEQMAKEARKAKLQAREEKLKQRQLELQKRLANAVETLQNSNASEKRINQENFDQCKSSKRDATPDNNSADDASESTIYSIAVSVSDSHCQEELNLSQVSPEEITDAVIIDESVLAESTSDIGLPKEIAETSSNDKSKSKTVKVLLPSTNDNESILSDLPEDSFECNANSLSEEMPKEVAEKEDSQETPTKTPTEIEERDAEEIPAQTGAESETLKSLSQDSGNCHLISQQPMDKSTTSEKISAPIDNPANCPNTRRRKSPRNLEQIDATTSIRKRGRNPKKPLVGEFSRKEKEKDAEPFPVDKPRCGRKPRNIPGDSLQKLGSAEPENASETVPIVRKRGRPVRKPKASSNSEETKVSNSKSHPATKGRHGIKSKKEDVLESKEQCTSILCVH